MRPSLVPPVIDKLVELARSVAPEGFEVFDGPTRDMETVQRYVLIGWSGQPDTRGIEAEVRQNGAAQYVEVIDVHGAVQAAFGDDGQKRARDAVYAVLDPFIDAVVGKTGVRSVQRVTRAELTRHPVEPYIGNGAGCVVMFTIHIEGTR
jgi:hypothetical protein